MEINVTNEAIADVFEVAGHIGANQSEELGRRLLAHLENDPARALVLDLSEANYINSTGLGVVLRVAKRMRESKRPFALSGLRNRVADVFALSGLDRILPVYHERGEAEAAIERGDLGAAAHPRTED